MKKHDIILVCIIVIVVLLSFGGIKYYQSQTIEKPKYAEITQNNVLVERIDLSAVKEPRDILLPGQYQEIVRVEKGRICFKETECLNQICVKTGWLSNPGDIAVCLPNKAIIVISEN